MAVTRQHRRRTPPTDLPEPSLLPFELVDDRLASPPMVSVVDGARSHLDVPIATVLGWRPLKVDVHLPEEGDGPFPVCVYAHGGAFVGGVKAMGPWGTLPSLGIAVVSVDYRLASEVVYPDSAEDIISAIRWVRSAPARYHLDPTRVSGWGSSAGAYLLGRAAVADGLSLGTPVPELARHSSTLDAVVLHYPVTDWLRRADDAERGLEGEMAERRVWHAIRRVFGVEIGECEPVRAGSIIGAVEQARAVPPFHIAHGDADTTVPIDQSRSLLTALSARGVEAELIEVPGEEHGTPAFSEPDIVGPAVRFLTSTWGRR